MGLLTPLKERLFVENWKKHSGDPKQLMANLVAERHLSETQAQALLKARKNVIGMLQDVKLAKSLSGTNVEEANHHAAMTVYSRAAEHAIRAGLTSHAKEYLAKAIQMAKISGASTDELQVLNNTLNGLK